MPETTAQCASADFLAKQIDHFWEYVKNGWEIEGREYFEKTYGELALFYAAHYMWKRATTDKCPLPEKHSGDAQYDTKGVIPLEEGLEYVKQSLVNSRYNVVKLFGVDVNVRGKSKRLETFLTHGTKCACCGLSGEYFSVDRQKPLRNTNTWYHLNMWGRIGTRRILFTHDHIIPRSAGGANKLDNTQTMCILCNAAKGSTVLTTALGFMKRSQA